ncbi:hypothetical protein ACE2AJ_03155 [Aquihabitans daechungensis]|uniref:hypothetical protein n=1 Tax=Aquihabitans daechungensis TaxID=1052257 RepID=UPI003BA165FE
MTDPGPSARVIAVLVALGVGVIFVVQLLGISGSTPGNDGEGGAWHPARSRTEKLVARMDGRAFAQTAADPLMRRTIEDYHGDAGKAAYRASRPLPGWMFLVGSLGGQRALLAPTMLLLSAITIGWAVYSVDVLGRALGLRVRYLAALVLSPAIITSIAYPGLGDPIGLALTFTGLAAWFRDRTWAAVGLFAAAGLCRETMLLVPLGLALHVVWEQRSLRPALPLALAPVAYVAWVAIVTARIGTAPDGGSQLAAPFSGMIEGMAYWHLAEYLTAALVVASTVVIVRRGFGWMKAIAAVSLGFASLMGTVVWFQWWGFGRVLTILPVFALVALARPRAAEVPAPAPAPAALATA